MKQIPATPPVGSAASDGFSLSTFRESDIDEITRLLQTDAVTIDLAQLPLHYTRQHAVQYFEYLENLKQNQPEIASLKFAIREQCIGKPMGRIDVAPDVDGWKIGYWLGFDYWGQEIMTWACKEILAVARACGITKIYGQPKYGNWASRRVLDSRISKMSGDIFRLMNGILFVGEWKHS